jgi:site-specific DNA-methyltransferase (adenine-specific)
MNERITEKAAGNNLLIRSDCKEALQKLIKDGIKVDLIYLDPPFNSSRIYNLLYSKNGITAQSKAFHDMWEINSQTQQMLFSFENLIDTMDISNLVKNFLKVWIAPLREGNVEDKRMLVYLIYMTERLVLMKEILKDTGSLYYHCDPTASHYIKIILDGIFGREKFRNEVVWAYGSGGTSDKWYPKKHDILLFYTKSKNYYFNQLKEKAYLDKSKGYNNKVEWLIDNNGEEYKLTSIRDVWNIPIINNNAKERLGYPTQKPVALLDRIMKASCPQGGIVLDPFCGCGTTIAGAIQNNLNWIGIDISYDAVDIMKDRIKNHLYFQGSYTFIDGSPETKAEYDKLNAFAKQDWLITKLGGVPNRKHSGDDGVDGDLTIHLGIDDKGLDKWGRIIFSVKAHKKSSPDMLRDLLGTMVDKKADMGILILDTDPSDNMVSIAQRQGEIEYLFKKDLPPNIYYKVQIITSDEIIDAVSNKRPPISIPPSLKEIKLFRDDKNLLI